MINVILATIIGEFLPFIAPRLTVDAVVVDEGGVPISNAVLTLATHRDYMERFTTFKSQEVRRITDANGKCKIKLDMYSHSIQWGASADQYYSSSGTIGSFSKGKRSLTGQIILKSSSIDFKVELRRIRNPQPMVEYGPCDEIVLPTTNGAWNVDLERMQLLPPYGNGREADAVIIKDCTMGNDYYSRCGRLHFLGDGNGFYKLPMHDGQLPSDYAADINTQYHHDVYFKHGLSQTKPCGVDKRDEFIYLDDGDYVIYRIRTRKEGGRIVCAHYGKIYGMLELGCNRIKAKHWYYNPRDNDTNLEDDPDRNIKIEDYRRQLGEAEKAKR